MKHKQYMKKTALEKDGLALPKNIMLQDYGMI
jgi:hypothetical protein